MNLTNIPIMSTIVVYSHTLDDSKTLVIHSRDSNFESVFGYQNAPRLHLADLMEMNSNDSFSNLCEMVQTGI